MRKSLLFLASAALFASCSSDLLESEGFQATNETGKGVTFQIVDDAATRGMIDTDPGDTYHSAFFFAEKDRISVWARNALVKYSSATQSFTSNTATTWAGVFAVAPVIYKATSSKGNPNYTSINDDNMLGLYTAPTTSDFFVAYPYDGQTVADAGGGKFTVTPNKNLLTQKMNGYMNIDSRLMYGYAGGQSKGTGVKEENKSVGEKVDMTLTSPLSTILFKYTNLGGYTAGIAGTTELGQLKDVTITSWTTPLVPAYNGQEIIVQNPDLIKVDDKWYVKSDVSPKHETYAQSENCVQIGPNWYIKSTCSLENGEWHVTDQSVQITTDPTTTEDPTGDIIGWNITGAPEYTPTAVLAGTEKVSIAANGTFTYNTANKTATYNQPAGQPLTWKAKLDVSAKAVQKDTEMNLFVLPVKREGKAETYTVTFNFANADLVEERAVTADFEANTGARTFTLDIVKRFPYIVTKGATATADRTLYINSSIDANGKSKKVRSIINGDGSVNWLDQFELEKVKKDYIKKVVIKAGVDKLEKEDWDALNRLTSVEELVIENNTEELLNVTGMTALKRLYASKVTKVNKNAFNATNGTNITDLNLHSVTNFPKITTSGFSKFTALQHLNLHSYEFGESQKNDVDPVVFFNDDTKTKLIDVDLSAVKSLAPLYAYTRTILFTGYTTLVGVTLNPEKVIFTQDEFKNCGELLYVNGVCDIDVSTSAFENCSKLETVHIFGDKIRANAFKQSGVKNVYKGAGNDKAHPVYVGSYAFSENTAIQHLDLANATEIGEYAFFNATSFGLSGYTRDVVTLNVQTVNNYAFSGTKIKRFQLLKAESTTYGSLNSTAVIQIKYMYPDLDPTKISSNQVLSGKNNIEIFGYNADDMDIFIPGYKSYTVETTAWAE